MTRAVETGFWMRSFSRALYQKRAASCGSIGLIALLVVAAATIAADIVIEVAVVGELVDIVLLAGRVVRVIVGDVVRLGVLARIVVDNPIAVGRTAAAAAAPSDVVDAQVVRHLVVAAGAVAAPG